MRLIRSFLLLLLLAISISVAQAPEGSDLGGLPRVGRLGVSLEPGASGVTIVAVTPHARVGDADVAPGDRIVTIDGQVIDGMPAIARALDRRPMGTRVVVELLRGEQEPHEVSIELSGLPMEQVEGQEVTYGSVRVGEHRLRTIVNRPEGSGPFPVVFFIQGLAPSSVDDYWRSGTHARLARGLAGRGFAFVRVEKFGVGDSEGPHAREVDFETECKGFLAGLRWTKQQRWADASRITIFGHSMGGVMGPRIAGEESVESLVVYGTGYRSWLEYELANLRRQMALGDADPDTIDETVANRARFVNEVMVEGRDPAKVIEEHPELRSFCPDGRTIHTRHWSFLHQLATLSFSKTWGRVNGRVLALWGESDFVSFEEDHQAIARRVSKGNPGRGTYRRVEGLDHGFFAHATEEGSFAAWMARRYGAFDPRIIEIVAVFAGEAGGAGASGESGG